MTKLMRKIQRHADLKTIILVVALVGFFITLVRYKQIVSEMNANDKPIVFVGGSPRSGTTLMRVMLDAHPMVRCGEETRIIPRFIQFTNMHLKSGSELTRMEEAGISREIINSAAHAYIFEIIKMHAKNAPYLCTKDPTTLDYSLYLAELFPNAKFILMIRDARAVVHSVISRWINSGGYQIKKYKENFENWNSLIERMYSQCMSVGAKRCLPVYYEQLVLQPEREMKNIIKFLGLSWNDAVLNHEKYIGEEISLSKTEKSSDQVIKPVNLEGLNAWFDKIPDDLLNEIDTLAPMLKKLGYDTLSKRPNYGEADQKILENTLKINENREYWINLAKNYSNLHALFDKKQLKPLFTLNSFS